MHALTRQLANAVGWHLPLARTLARREAAILVYHGVPRQGAEITAAVFEQHVRFIVRHFHVVSPAELSKKRKGTSRITVLLTFDDGFRNHAEVVAPILTKYGVPAVFFIPSRHTQRGKYLWFSYLRLLESQFRGNGFTYAGEFWNMAANQRAETVARLRRRLLELTPHPSAMYRAIEDELPRLEDFVPSEVLRDHAEGMTPEQIGDIARNPLFTVGVHTVDHPFLTLCDRAEATRQIEENRGWLQSISGQPCDSIAYPVSDFNADVLQQCNDLGFRSGFSVEQRIEGDARLQLPRVGVYYPSLAELGCKVRWGAMVTRLKRPPLSAMESRSVSPAAAQGVA